MTGQIEARLIELGIDLPMAAAPAASYVAAVRTGGHLYVSGQLPIFDSELRHTGKLGGGVEIEEGQAAARLCALNILSQALGALGTLDRVSRVVKLVGFVNSAPDFVDQPRVVDAASQLMLDVFGDAGQHARSAVGVAGLPFGAAVEVEAVLEVSL